MNEARGTTLEPDKYQQFQDEVKKIEEGRDLGMIYLINLSSKHS